MELEVTEVASWGSDRSQKRALFNISKVVAADSSSGPTQGTKGAFQGDGIKLSKMRLRAYGICQAALGGLARSKLHYDTINEVSSGVKHM